MSNSIYGINSTRLTGMASGLDTESIIEKMLTMSKAKIDAVEQKKQLLVWKQEFYQEVATSLQNFQNKYFSTTTSFSDSLSKLSATSSSNLVSATSSANAKAGKIYIDDIISLASAAKLTSSNTVSANPTININTAAIDELSGKSIIVNLNGVEKTIKFDTLDYLNSGDVAAQLQTRLNAAFGSNKIDVELNGDKMTLSAANSTLILKASDDTSGPLEFNSFSSNRVEMNVSLASAGFASSLDATDGIAFSINGVDFNFESTTSLSQIMKAINSSSAGVNMTYSNLTDKFTLTSTETGSGSAVVFEDKTGNLMQSIFGEGNFVAGTDAVVRLSDTGSEADAITVTRSTNTFDINGTTLTLNGMAEGNAKESISIAVNYDTNAMVEKVKAFVTDYNTLLGSINDKISEKYDRDYQPLTDEQKKAMSEDEVELWTKKAKTGILSNDIYLKDIATKLRSIFYTPISNLEDNALSIGDLSSLGISTPNYNAKGQLKIDEEKLRNAFNTGPLEALLLFSQESKTAYSLYSTEAQQQKRFNESGVLERLADLFKTNLNKVGKKGALINLVGSPDDKFSGETDYKRRIIALEDKMSSMNISLAKEEERYWRQFSMMESALANLNQQSSWISNMLGNNTAG